jgi:hypothetical protein
MNVSVCRKNMEVMMLLDMVKPINVFKLLAGLSHMFFERVGGNGHVVVNGQQKTTAVVRDDFTIINGIGPTFAKRLQEAGIHTFADLAASTPEHLRDAAQVAEWQGDPAEWIVQAKALS